MPCAIFGGMTKGTPVIFDTVDALYDQQNRANDAAYALIMDSKTGASTRPGGPGSVAQAFNFSLEPYEGDIGLGHLLYRTEGKFQNSKNTQPIFGSYRGHPFWVVHNGNLYNIQEVAAEFGVDVLDWESDTRILSRIIAQSDAETFKKALQRVLPLLKGSFCFIFLYRNEFYVVKDRFGIHPLHIGTRGDDFLVASESCALDLLEVDWRRDVLPGEMITINREGYESEWWTEIRRLMAHIFEYVYLSRPDSEFYGVEVGTAQELSGRELAFQNPAPEDAVGCPVSDSGNSVSWGYYQGNLARGVKMEYHPHLLFRPHTTGRAGRSFMQHDEAARKRAAAYKHRFRQRLLRIIRLSGSERPRIFPHDDSGVRFTTYDQLKEKLHKGGSELVGMAIGSPPYMFPDRIGGFDTARKPGELYAPRFDGDVERMRQALKAEYLFFLELMRLKRAIIAAQREDVPAELRLDENSFMDLPFTGYDPYDSL